MRVQHVMTLNPVTCDVGDSCEKAARLMRERVVGSVCVLDRGRLVGLVTDRLLARECIAAGRGIDTPVSDVMIGDVATVSPDDSIFAACDTMRSAYMARRLPVVNERRELLGIVSIADIAAIAKDLLQAILDAELHHARKKTRALTGAKRIGKRIRRPTKLDRLLPEPPLLPKRQASREGVVRNPMRRMRRGRRPLPRAANTRNAQRPRPQPLRAQGGRLPAHAADNVPERRPERRERRRFEFFRL